MNEAKEFYDLEAASTSGLSHVPTQPMSIPSPRRKISRDSCLQPDTRNSLGTSGHVFEGPPAPGEPSSALFGNSKNLASVSCRSKPIDTGKNCGTEREVLRKEPQNCSIPTPRFARKFSSRNPLYHAGGTYLQNCMMEIPRNQISELHFDEFPDTSGFQCWQTNCKTEVRSCSGCSAVAMLWITEVEVAKSVDDLMTSQSIEGHVFLDFEMLDAKTACALKRIITNQYFRRRIDVEEQHAQKYDRILRRRHIADMVYEHVRATGAHQAALDLSDLFHVLAKHSGCRYKMGPSSTLCK